MVMVSLDSDRNPKIMGLYISVIGLKLLMLTLIFETWYHRPTSWTDLFPRIFFFFFKHRIEKTAG